MLEYTLTRFDICITPTRSQDFPEFTEPEVEQNLVVTQVRHVSENILQLLKRIKTCNKKTFWEISIKWSNFNLTVIMFLYNLI